MARKSITKPSRRPKNVEAAGEIAIETTSDVILRESARLFAEKGYEGASVREIAVQSNITIPTIYYFFGDKRRLYIEACRHEFGKAGQMFEQASRRGKTPRERLYSLTLQQCLEVNRPIATKLLRRALIDHDTELLALMTDALFAPLMEPLAEMVGEIAPDRDPWVSAMLVCVMVSGLSDILPVNASLKSPAKLPKSAGGTAALVLNTLLPELGPFSESSAR